MQKLLKQRKKIRHLSKRISYITEIRSQWASLRSEQTQTAYVMAKTYDILYQLPILIVEKMGPHFAVGDTCYSHCEETEVRNPDGKEIVAKYNECSKEGEYFQCHTDITIPYEELDSICAITLGGDEILLIKDGKFVLSGTETLMNH